MLGEVKQKPLDQTDFPVMLSQAKIKSWQCLKMIQKIMDVKGLTVIFNMWSY